MLIPEMNETSPKVVEVWVTTVNHTWADKAMFSLRTNHPKECQNYIRMNAPLIVFCICPGVFSSSYNTDCTYTYIIVSGINLFRGNQCQISKSLISSEHVLLSNTDY